MREREREIYFSPARPWSGHMAAIIDGMAIEVLGKMVRIIR